MAHHKDLTGADLHEPKGVAGASSGQVYVANGGGSGNWTSLAGSYITLTRVLDDVSTPSSVRVPCPVGGTVVRITAVLEAGITVADSNVTFDIGGVAIDSSAIVVSYSGSAAGSQFNSTPSGHNTVTSTSVIKITTDGASTSTAPLVVTVLIRVS